MAARRRDEDEDEVGDVVAELEKEGIKVGKTRLTANNTFFSLSLIVAGVSPLVAFVWFTATYSSDFKAMRADLTAAQVKQEAILTRIGAMEFLIAQRHVERDAEMTAIRKDIDALRMDVPKVQEMWFMKTHGVSNKEDFMLRNGYSAPASPTGLKPE